MTAGFALVGAKPRGEFQSHEAEFEKGEGEVEIEYRGAYIGGCLRRPTKTRTPTISFKAMS